MANGSTEFCNGMTCVLFEKTVTLTVNKNNANEIDFSDDILHNTPGPYKFDHLEYLGVWPLSTWTNAIVSCASGWSDTSIFLQTLSTQNFTVRVLCWYRRI